MTSTYSVRHSFITLCFVAAFFLAFGQRWLPAQMFASRNFAAIAPSSRTNTFNTNPSNTDTPDIESPSPNDSLPFSRTSSSALQTGLNVVQPRILVDLSDRKVYIYQAGQLKTSYTIAVGKDGWETPTGQFTVTQMKTNPVWRHPITKEVFSVGKENPLGTRWIGFWVDGEHQIGFHGTNQPNLVGQAVSHGCLRMRNADIEALFRQVSLGTSVLVRI
jgi:L,D-transpeptidase ErfK/SrfK